MRNLLRVMRPINSDYHTAAISTRFAFLLFVLTAALGQAKADDRDTGAAIWQNDELAAIFHVTVQREVGRPETGTAFRVSPRYALTAKHLAGREDVTGVEKTKVTSITLRQGGPDGPERHLDPRNVYAVKGSDIAILDLGFVEPPPPSLPLGSSRHVQRNDFVTFYGYGLNEPGAIRVGRIDLSDTQSRVFRAEINSARGFSGAPVLNRRGNVIGIVSRGTQNLAYIVPIHHAEPDLRRLNILIPGSDMEPDRISERMSRNSEVQRSQAVDRGWTDGNSPDRRKLAVSKTQDVAPQIDMYISLSRWKETILLQIYFSSSVNDDAILAHLGEALQGQYLSVGVDNVVFVEDEIVPWNREASADGRGIVVANLPIAPSKGEALMKGQVLWLTVTGVGEGGGPFYIHIPIGIAASEVIKNALRPPRTWLF